MQRLVSSFLIKVTEFFRDPDLFNYLRDQVLPGMIAEARERGELRIWSAGCATGEEAYSLAMLIADQLGDDLNTFPVRIFATDIALDAVDFARRGIYPAEALAHLPADLIERHFVHHDGAYEVRKQVRALVIFGDHDLRHRAPFPRIDLILCRNVLIYFTADLQRRALQLFAFSLRRGGYLALGKSESVSPLPEFFALEQPRLKLFRRVGGAMPIPTTQLLDVTSADLTAGRAGRRAPSRRLAPLDQPSLAAPLIQRFDHLFDALATGIVAVNQHYDVLTINARARQLLGINTAAVGEDLVHRVTPSLAQLLRAALDAALRGESTTSMHRLPRDVIDGDGGHIAITCSPLWSTEPGTAIEAVLVEIQDVSTYARRQHALESTLGELQSEQDLLREQTTAALSELRELRGINRTMAAEQSRLRMEAELLQLAHEEAQAAAEEIETLNEEQQATNEELETVNEELQATVEELQATVGELSATNDELQNRTTQLESMAQTLKEQQDVVEVERSRLSAILANMGDAVLVLNARGETVLTNAAYDRLFGSHTAFVPEDDQGRPLDRAEWPQQRAMAGEAATLTFTLRGPAGELRAFESNVQPVEGSEGERWGVIVLRDITERGLRRQHEQFLAVAAHELRTPLTVLSGRIQLLARRLGVVSTDERLAEHAGKALDQARRLEADIDELLDAARLQFGSIVLDRQPVDLTSIVRQAVGAATTLAMGQTIHVDGPDAPVMVWGDERRLERVILNLLSNAITYAPDTEQIDVRLRSEGSEAIIEVQDFGQGMPPDALSRIFERFERLEQGPTSRGGLGLGLFIAREIVHAHGGLITAQSTLGDGATFTVRLPLLDPDAPREA